MDTVEPGLLDQIEIEHRQVGHRGDPFGIVGAAKPGMLGDPDLVALGKRIEERQPLRHAARAVQEQHAFALPRAMQLHLDAAYVELAGLRGHLALLSKAGAKAAALARKEAMPI